MHRIIFFICFTISSMAFGLGDHKTHLAANGAPIMAGYWEESSGKVWKSSQRGNIFIWTQHGTNKVAKGIIVAKYPNADEPSDWLVAITFEHTLAKTNMILEFNSDYTQLTSKNDVYKRVLKPTSIRVNFALN